MYSLKVDSSDLMKNNTFETIILEDLQILNVLKDTDFFLPICEFLSVSFEKPSIFLDFLNKFKFELSNTRKIDISFTEPISNIDETEILRDILTDFSFSVIFLKFEKSVLAECIVDIINILTCGRNCVVYLHSDLENFVLNLNNIFIIDL